MRLGDSYDALAASIERTIRTHLEADGSGADLAPTIEENLHEESRGNELRLAYARVVVALMTLAVTFGAALPAAGITALRVVAVLWLAAAITLAWRLRAGWCPKWLQYIAPAIDGGAIWALVVAAGWPSDGTDVVAGTGPRGLAPGFVGLVGALCAFLAVSGSLRLSHTSAQISTVLALAVFLHASIAAGLHHLVIVAAAGTLVMTGVLCAGVATLVRRVVTNQVEGMALSRLVREARQTIDAREQVLRIVSHDLRNPLSTIKMSAELMLDVPLPEEKRVKQLHTIKRAGERMNRLVQDLLEVAKLESGRLGIDLREVEVSSLMAEAAETLAPLAAEKSLRLETVVPPERVTIRADAGRILQALSNLVGNAIKFTPAGGRVTIRAEQATGGLRFAVADTGAGMTREQLPHIFGRFWQADANDRRGIGLGLAITKGIVEAHGGRIWVDSQPGKGTTFYFTLGETTGRPVAAVADRRSGEVDRRSSGAARESRQ